MVTVDITVEVAMNRRQAIKYVLGTAAGAAVAAAVSERVDARQPRVIQGTVEHMDGVPGEMTNIETGVVTPAGAPLPLLPASAYPAHSHPLIPAFPQYDDNYPLFTFYGPLGTSETITIDCGDGTFQSPEHWYELTFLNEPL